MGRPGRAGLTLDGCTAAPGDDLGWSSPSDELFQWESDGGGDRPGAARAQVGHARRWRDAPEAETGC